MPSPHPAAPIPVVHITLLAIVVIVFLAGSALIFGLSHPPVRACQAAATPVIDALEQDRRDHQRYPQALSELVPVYLAQPPRPDFLTAYLYAVCPDGAAYVLNFHPGGAFILQTHWCGYGSAFRQWKCVSGTVPVYYHETVKG
jgi:hypothetical protein